MAPENGLVDTPVPVATTVERNPHDSSAPVRSHFLLTFAQSIRMPKAMSADITAEAGAVKLDGLDGAIHITTEAGAVEGLALTSDEVQWTSTPKSARAP